MWRGQFGVIRSLVPLIVSTASSASFDCCFLVPCLDNGSEPSQTKTSTAPLNLWTAALNLWQLSLTSIGSWLQLGVVCSLSRGWYVWGSVVGEISCFSNSNFLNSRIQWIPVIYSPSILCFKLYSNHYNYLPSIPCYVSVNCKLILTAVSTWNPVYCCHGVG